MVSFRSGCITTAALAALLGTATTARAQHGGPPDLQIRPSRPPIAGGVVTPEEFWSRDYRSGELFKSLIAPEQMNLTRSRKQACRLDPGVCRS